MSLKMYTVETSIINAMQLCNSFTMLMQNPILLHLGLKVNDLGSKPSLLKTKRQCVCQIWTVGSMAEFLYWTVQEESDCPLCHMWRVWTKKSVLRCISYSFSFTQDTKIVAHSCVATVIWVSYVMVTTRILL